MHIAMVVFGDLRFDYRVFREATSLHQAGHRISIVASAFSPDPLEGWDDFAIHAIAVDRSRSLRATYPAFWRRAYQLLLSLDADAYHAHDLDALWPAARAAKRQDVPLVYDSHEFWTEQSSLVQRLAIRSFWAMLERHLIQRANGVITVSESIARALEQRYDLEKVTVLRNLPHFKEPLPGDLIRTELQLEADRPIVLYQGGFLTENGLSEQIEAAAGFSRAALVLIGDGPSEGALKAQVARAGLADRVYFIPRVPFHQLHAYTCSADLGLCLIKGAGKSFYYSMPNKLFEYLIAGLPVLASNFPEMSSVIDATKAGEVVDPQDVTAIRDCIERLLGDMKLRQQYAGAARNAARHYNWEQESHHLIELYASL